MNDYNNLVKETLFRVTKERIISKWVSEFGEENYNTSYKNIVVHDIIFDGVSYLDMCVSKIMGDIHNDMLIIYHISYKSQEGWVRRRFKKFDTTGDMLDMARQEVKKIRRLEILNDIC